MADDLSHLTDEQLLKLLQERAASESAPEKRPTSYDAAKMMTRGMTLSGTDYAGAAARWSVENTLGNVVDAVKGKGMSYHPFDDALKAERADVEAYRKENPVKANVAEFGGGLMIGGPLKATPTLAKRVLMGGGAGAAAGALNAQSEGGGLPSLEQFLKSTGTGTAIGGGFGAVSPAVAKGGGAMLTGVRDFGQNILDHLPFNQESGAVRKVMQSLGRDSTDIPTLIANRQRLGPGANVVDAAGTFDEATGTWLGGRATRKSADTLVTLPGKTGDLAERVLKPRPGAAGTEVIGAVDRNISNTDFYTRLDQLGAKKQADASPRYKEAYEKFQVLSSPFLANMAEDPLIRQAAEEGQKGMARAARARGEVPGTLTKPFFDFDESGAPKVSGSWSLEQWDTVKKGIDRMLNNMRDANGRLPKTSEVRDLVHFKNSMVDTLDNLTTVEGKSLYSEARKAWAGPAALEDAMWTGRDFMRGDHELVVSRFKKLSGDEQQSFLDGMAREIESTIEATGTVPHRLKAILNPESKARKVLQQVLPADQFQGFTNSLAGVVKKLDTSRIIGGSDTAARLAGKADIGSDLSGVAIDALQGRPVSATLGALRAFGQRLAGPSEGMRDEMGQLLLNPDRFDDLIVQAQKRAKMAAPNQRWQRRHGNSLLDATPAAGGGLLSLYATQP